MLSVFSKFKQIINEINSKETVLWTGISQGGNYINVNVNGYSRLRVKVRLSGIIVFVEVDLTEITINITKDSIVYNYGNAVSAGAMDGEQYLNKASIAVNSDKTKVIGYNFGYASLASNWNFQNRDGSGNSWAILEIVGIK